MSLVTHFFKIRSVEYYSVMIIHIPSNQLCIDSSDPPAYRVPLKRSVASSEHLVKQTQL